VIFRPELAQKVLAGEKTVTRRVVSDNPRSPWWRDECAYNVGQDYAVQPGRGKPTIGRLRIIRVTRQALGEAFGQFGDRATADRPDVRREARLEGFNDAVAFQLAWLKINRTYDESALVWRVEFKPIPNPRPEPQPR
jgi:hypothetical protein